MKLGKALLRRADYLKRGNGIFLSLILLCIHRFGKKLYKPPTDDKCGDRLDVHQFRELELSVRPVCP